MSRNRYYFVIDDFARARGSDARFAFSGAGPNDLATAIEAALRGPGLFDRWRAAQPDPDAVDATLAAHDDGASASARVVDLHVAVELVTNLPLRIVRQRLDLLIGAHWTLRDVRAV